MDLYRLFLDCCGSIADDFFARRCWQELVHFYTQPHRYYHHIWHMEQVTELVAEHSQDGYSTDERRALILAAMYHDIVYDVSPNRLMSNEAESAALFLAHATLLDIKDDLVVTQAHDLILTTTYSDGRSHNLLNDADLVGIGSSWDTYSINGELIRKEYGVTHERWNAGRTQFLKRFMHNEPIYFTPRFQELYEKQARENLLRDFTNCQQG